MKRHLIQAKGLLIAAAIITALAAINSFRPVEETGWALRNNLFSSEASGSVVVVQIDGKTEKNRSERLAAAIRTVSYGRPKNVLIATDPDVVDVLLIDPDTRARMNALGKKLVVPVTATPPSDDNAIAPDSRDISQFTATVSTGDAVRTSPFGMIWQYAYGVFTKDSFMPSQASAISGINNQSDQDFLVDYSYRLSSIPQISSNDVNYFNIIKSDFRNRTVIVGFSGESDALKAGLPGFNFVASKGLLHAYAAETLIHGPPQYYGFILPLLAALVAALFANILGVRRNYFILGWTVTVISFVVVPWYIGAWHYNFDVAPALALLIVGLSLQMRQDWKDRLKLTSSSGAPSFDAFGSQTITAGAASSWRGWAHGPIFKRRSASLTKANWQDRLCGACREPTRIWRSIIMVPRASAGVCRTMAPP